MKTTRTQRTHTSTTPALPHPAPMPPPLPLKVYRGEFLKLISDRRDRAIVAMLRDTGLRAQEILSLDKASVSLNEVRNADGVGQLVADVVVLHVKAACSQRFVLSKSAATALREYLGETRSEDAEPALFVGGNGARLTRGGLDGILRRCSDVLGVDGLSIRRFRLSLAQKLLKEGRLYR